MKVPVKSATDIGQVIRITRISQNLDQLTASQLSNAGQSFLSHLENGKETAQIGKVLQVLESLGIGVELTLPPDVEALLVKHNKSSNHNSIRYSRYASSDIRAEDSSQINQHLFRSGADGKYDRINTQDFLELWGKVPNSKRVRRS
jgi:transcriptional regulator with XRE-family HTH domain